MSEEVEVKEEVKLPESEPAQEPEKAVSESEPEEKSEVEKPAEKEPTDDSTEKRGTRRFERRIAAATKREAEQRARADFLERQLQELKPRTQDTGAPRLENFSDIEEYATAKAEYAKAQALKELTENQQREAQQRELAEVATAWEAKVARAKYDDFDEVVGDLKPINPFALAVMEAENAEEVAYYLGKHPKEAARIAVLNQRAMVREITKLESKLMSEPQKPKTPSKAPAPITPLSGNSGASSDLPQDSDDINTWMRKENARMKKASA